MLFLVISTPAPSEPSAVRERRQRYWNWIAPLQAAGIVKSVYSRVGRGVVALFDVDSNETLHRYMNEWSDMVPATFDVYPLIDPEAARSFLSASGSGPTV